MTTPFPFVAGTVLTAAKLNDITNLPLNDQTASYVAVVGDAGKRVVMNVASANTVTVNNSIFTVGDTLQVVNKGAGATTITAGAGVTINSASGLELAQYQSGTLVALSASSFLFFESDGGSITTATATVATSQSTSSTTYTDLATAGPAVTLTTGTKVLVFTNTEVSTAAGRYVFADFAISGATTRAASDDTCIKMGTDADAMQSRNGVANLMTVTAGSNTFTMKYRANAGTNSFANRSIVVVAL
jgi:hypothetical protein